MIWGSCASLCSLFSSFSSSHLTASPWNLFQSDWQHRRAFWNARYSQSKTYFHILPRRKSALTRRCSSLPTSRYPRCEQGVESGRCAAYRGLLVSRFDPHYTPWSRQGAVLHFTHVRMKVLFLLLSTCPIGVHLSLHTLCVDRVHNAHLKSYKLIELQLDTCY